MDQAPRSALITGAGSPGGIGFATAKQLGLDGTRVMLTSTTDRIQARVDELQALGIDATGYVTRLDTEPEVARLFDGLHAAGTTPSIVVNNAGMITVNDAEMESGDILGSVDAWNRSLASNLTTAFLVSRAAVPAMRDAGWGRIVNVSSLTGHVMAARADVAYAAAKAGMVGLTRALAVDEAPHGITVNAVAPGWIATLSQLPEEAVAGTRVPVGRSGTPDEVASAIVWLASREASYVTGQVIVIDGGNSIAEER
ncbi:MAG: SDR family NAD(P)-dependent oxidoreductase [Pseudolysinimonas sp.]|uniref:SDR family NAD(P)-dependent oxidoreductase n=1 Tax=Pseudolysinimonas sp. TaxID=2680009 RepID=UPI0032656C4C